MKNPHVCLATALLSCLLFSCLLLSGCRLDSVVDPSGNLVPVADAGPDLTVTDANNDGTEPVELDGSGSSDPDGSITAWVWSVNDQAIATGMAPTVALPTGAHTLRLVVTDNQGAFAEDEVVVTVRADTDAGNAPPVADAGADQVVVDLDANGKERVTLDPSGSQDPDGRIVDWVWTVDSERIRVDGHNRATFELGRHTVTLTVTDDRGATDTDTVIIEVVSSNENLPPVADAGPDRTVEDRDGNGREVVEVEGSGTDPDGTIVGWEWLENSTVLATGRTADLTLDVGTHRITLRVTDDGGLTGTDAVTITVAAVGGNEPPVANAGADRSIPDTDGDGSELVSLDGSGSTDPDGSIVSWVWTEGAAELATGATVSVSLPVGSHTITLTVTDDAGATDTDTAVVTVTEVVANQPPTADAGPDRTVPDADGSGSETVMLDGSGSSDSDGTIASWTWREGGSQLATGRTPSVTLTVGVHTITLTVTDDGGATDTDTAVITVTEVVANQPPTADAGPDQTVLDADGSGSETVTLDGSGSSDSDGTIASWTWREGASQLATGRTPSVTLAVGVHTITLTVTDDGGDTDTDTVVITIDQPVASVSYSRDIQPYFDDKCIGCHRNGGPRGVDLDSWQSVMAGGSNGPLVVPGDSSQGTLLPQIRDGHMGAPHGTTIEQDLVSWIEAGALDN